MTKSYLRYLINVIVKKGKYQTISISRWLVSDDKSAQNHIKIFISDGESITVIDEHRKLLLSSSSITKIKLF